MCNDRIVLTFVKGESGRDLVPFNGENKMFKTL